MPQEMVTANEGLIPANPIPDGARDFSKRVHGLMDGKPKDEATVAKALEGMEAMIDLIAAGLYNLASMLVGEGEDSVRLVETAIATAELSACHDPLEGRKSSRRALCSAALDLLEQRNPGCLAAPEGLEPATTCIDDKDLDSMDESSEELLRLLAGPDRDRARSWLAGLPTLGRTIFVLRAVAGFTAPEIAGMLAEHGGPRAAGWTAEAVREFCRQGLCSLASQLLQAASR
jgi:DNA-directed RNA polymerase specialized sigma24 family protein